MSQLNELQLLALQTITSTTTGSGVSVAALTGDFTIHIRVQALSAATGTVPTVRIAVEEATSNSFSPAINMGTFSTEGPIGGLPQQADIHFTMRARDMTGTLFGTAGAYARINVTVLGGTSPSCTLEAWASYSA